MEEQAIITTKSVNCTATAVLT